MSPHRAGRGWCPPGVQAQTLSGARRAAGAPEQHWQLAQSCGFILTHCSEINPELSHLLQRGSDFVPACVPLAVNGSRGALGQGQPLRAPGREEPFSLSHTVLCHARLSDGSPANCAPIPHSPFPYPEHSTGLRHWGCPCWWKWEADPCVSRV